MSNLVNEAVLKNQKLKSYPNFSSGDTVSVSVKVKEGEKERIQIFKGVVLKIQGSGPSRSFTVRKISEGIGVEKTFHFISPIVDKVEILAYGKTRQARLFYLRSLKGRAAKIRSELAVMREQREKNRESQKDHQSGSDKNR